MGWERRRNGTYYYRARKVGGRVLKEYVGAGPLSELVAAQDTQARAERRATNEARRAERARLTAVDDAVDASHAASDTLVRASLVMAGYHLHNRGEWRRRHGDGNDEGTGHG